ncbi:hypothetical protein K1719_001166 [Acacia pycnantha]|nr:hypothetical protein K1719_001166 [Acacia pycnantha]
MNQFTLDSSTTENTLDSWIYFILLISISSISQGRSNRYRGTKNHGFDDNFLKCQPIGIIKILQERYSIEELLRLMR